MKGFGFDRHAVKLLFGGLVLDQIIGIGFSFRVLPSCIFTFPTQQTGGLSYHDCETERERPAGRDVIRERETGVWES